MTQPALASFGAGRLFVQNTDIVPATPIEFGILQGCDFDFSFSTKPLFGSNQFAVFVARGEAKWSMKAKSGVMSGQLINSLFFGQTLAAGQTGLQASEGHTVPPSGSFTIGVVPPSSGAFVADEGVVYSASGLPLTLVTSAPGVGQYEQAAGLYTFSKPRQSRAGQYQLHLQLHRCRSESRHHQSVARCHAVLLRRVPRPRSALWSLQHAGHQPHDVVEAVAVEQDERLHHSGIRCRDHGRWYRQYRDDVVRRSVVARGKFWELYTYLTQP